MCVGQVSQLFSETHRIWDKPVNSFLRLTGYDSSNVILDIENVDDDI